MQFLNQVLQRDLPKLHQGEHRSACLQRCGVRPDCALALSHVASLPHYSRCLPCRVCRYTRGQERKNRPVKFHENPLTELPACQEKILTLRIEEMKPNPAGAVPATPA